MFLEGILEAVADVMIRAVGNFILGIFGRHVRTRGTGDDLLVWVVGLGFWILVAGGIYLLFAWLV